MIRVARATWQPLLILGSGFASLPIRAATPPPVDFSREVQPILSENCYACHGPDPSSRKAELRLDRREDALTVITPGKPDTSELVRRILSDDPDEIMPAPESHRTLTPAQKETLKRWVAEGAPWGEHWAFVAPKKPTVPNVGSARASVRNPVDAFVIARLAQERLWLSPEAPKEKLIRRVTLDLTGVPPTPAEVDAFLADRSADAYEKVVDRLLASPRYGERMVWEWLDAARYADTNGFQADPTRTMWPWRDWVIRAFNGNMPYDQFTIEQLAGDLLPNATRDQKLATGFNRNHMLNNEGGSIPEESRVSYVLDRVDTTATVWLGLTMACARCHDHKFDPLSQKEYYQFSAYFNQLPERGNADANPMANPLLSLASPEEEAMVAELRAVEAKARNEREAREREIRAAQPQWEQRVLADGLTMPEPAWTPFLPDGITTHQGATMTKLPDGSVRVGGTNADGDEIVATGFTNLRGGTAILLELLPDESLPRGGPGRADDGSVAISDFMMQVDGRTVDLQPLSADATADGASLAQAIDSDTATSWVSAPGTGGARRVIFQTAFSGRDNAQISLRIQHHGPKPQQVPGRLRISFTNANVATLRPLSAAAMAALRVPPAERPAAVAKELTDVYLALSPERAAAIATQDEARRAADNAAKSLLKVMVMQDRPEGRDTFILERGAYDQLREKVSPGTPAILPPLPAGAPPNRLALARWLVAPDHPLTARVTVNRFWAQFFGHGLVGTPADFGLQGEKPTHPALLDWLAREFIESGWDVKRLVRLFVTSATYRQNARVTPTLLERDPENHLLARAPRHRLPSWMLRDQALAISGLLVEKLGGPGVNGYQPPGIWEEATFGMIKYRQDTGDALYRRSVYTFWRRIVGPTIFFDTANRQICTVTTARTNTPLHALTTLNDVTYVEAARVLAERMLKAGGADDAARIAFAFRLCTARRPTKAETDVLTSSLARFRKQFAAAPADARTFIAAGESKPDAALDAVDLAAHTALASLLLNLDETQTKE